MEVRLHFEAGRHSKANVVAGLLVEFCRAPLPHSTEASTARGAVSSVAVALDDAQTMIVKRNIKDTVLSAIMR